MISTTSRVAVSITVAAETDVTATHRRSGLTATDAPREDHATVSPTSTCSTTSPVRGSRNVAATSTVVGPGSTKKVEL